MSVSTAQNKRPVYRPKDLTSLNNEQIIRKAFELYDFDVHRSTLNTSSPIFGYLKQELGLSKKKGDDRKQLLLLRNHFKKLKKIIPQQVDDQSQSSSCESQNVVQFNHLQGLPERTGSADCLISGLRQAVDPVMSKLSYHRELVASDPAQAPVLIIGQQRHLKELPYEKVRNKLEPRVTKQIFEQAKSALHPTPTDTCSLYLDLAKLAALPTKASRHNSESRAHAITKLVQFNSSGVTESIVLVCERENAFASGCAVARAFPLYSRKTSKGDDSGGKCSESAAVNVEFLLEGEGCLTKQDVQVLEHAAKGIRLAAKIVDAPCNEMNVSGFLQEVETVARELKITPKIIRGEELKEQGFGGIYGVGKAAADPPALAVLSYEPEGATETVAWVGKGIVFDTGGLSIKGKTAMPGMKRDCGGAAAILGAFYAAVKCGFKQNLHAVFCLAENSVGPDSTRPDDIHRLYSGSTVEINNTDAEGRLVLADGVCYANRDLQATVILDMATLTGAQGIATGKYHGAILTNSDEWEQKALIVGRKTADLLSPVPYCPEMHFCEFKSAVADMKNSVMDRGNAQVSCAGLFIGAHLGFDYPGAWMHVDMASPVHNGERATGYGVALLMGLFGQHSEAQLLKEVAAAAEGRCLRSSNEPQPKKARVN